MELSRFALVSLACVVAHNAIVIAGDFAGLHYLASTVISFCVVVVLGYSLHRAWTFPAAAGGAASFARYALSMSLNLPLFAGALYLLVDLLRLPVAAAAPLATVLLWAFNFAATRWALRR